MRLGQDFQRIGKFGLFAHHGGFAFANRFFGAVEFQQP